MNLCQNISDIVGSEKRSGLPFAEQGSGELKTEAEVYRVGMVFAAVVMAALFCRCENVLWNDLAAQGAWQKDCKVLLKDKAMEMEIDNSGIRWKEKGADDWEEDLPCTASFGVLSIKFPGGTIKGSYFWCFNYLILSGFTWDDGLNWLNGSWEK
jgi:hypothetical protein